MLTAIANKRKNEVQRDYSLAIMISSFNNRAQHGKQPPSLEDLYPSLFKSEKKNDESYWAMQKELLIDFANEANKRRRTQ